jgi:HEAT repeat protein
MKKRRALRLGVAVVLLAGFAVVIPGSPLYLPNWLVLRGQHEGRSARSWMRDLKDPDVEARQTAAKALGTIGPDAAEAVPALVEALLGDHDRGVRIASSFALTRMDPAAPEMAAAVPDLAKGLTDADPLVRMNVALALLRLEGRARPAAEALIRAVRDDNNQTNADIFYCTVQDMAALALGRSGSPEAVPALSQALSIARTGEARQILLSALGECGAGALSVLPQMKPFLQDNSEEVRQAAADALKRIDGKTYSVTLADDGPSDLQLPDKARLYLWEIEHHGNLLVKYGFGPLAQALKNADTEALSRLLADPFAGADMREPKSVRAKSGATEIERLQDAGKPPLPLDRVAFAARLLDLRKIFTGTPQVKLALMNLGPKQRGQLDGAWEGTAQLRLNGEHAPGAPAEVIVWLHYELPQPTEEALARPGWLRGAAIRQTLVSRAPNYLFAEVANQRGLKTAWLYDNWKIDFTQVTPQVTPGGVYVCDFDRDGVLDVLVTDVNGNALYRGRPDGTFEDVTDRVGLPRRAASNTSAAWIDIDGDGWDDLLLAGKVLRNTAGQKFEDYTARCNLRLPRDASALLVADYDHDGKLDLYVTRGARPGKRSWLQGRSADSHGNFLYRNKGGWQFEDVTVASGASGGHRSTFTAGWLDANNDGWPDLHVPNEFGDGVLLINNRDGTFSPRPLANRPADFGTMGIAVGDVNNDGHIDIYCANMYSKAGTRVVANMAPDAYPADVMEKMRRFVAGSQLHLNRGGDRFDQAGPPMQVAGVGWAYGACLADLDNDGWLDIYATAGFVSRNRDEPDG